MLSIIRIWFEWTLTLKTAPEDPRWTGCFATYDAFATGVNLNAARHVIMIDDEWNPGMEDQAIGRIDRLILWTRQTFTSSVLTNH